jgi:predicted ATP-grasp superfamily ATP-dependent carboligase
MYYSISRTILQWAKENECKLIISAGTILGEESTGSLKEPDLQTYTRSQVQKGLEKN